MNSRIISPIPTGSGAFVFHKTLDAHIPGYQVRSYTPELTLFPPILPFLGLTRKAKLIHTTPDHGLFFRKPSVPMVVTALHLVFDRFMQPYSSSTQWLHYRTDLRWFTKASLRMADRVTAISRFTANMVQRELCYDQPIQVIYNGIETDLFRPGTPVSRDGIRVIFSGNPSLRKGFQWLPAIVQRLNKGIRVYFTSGMRGRSVITLTPNLIGLGNISTDSMPDLYRSHDILVSPTVREGFGLSIAEAMACGLPVVASDCSSVPELVDHGKGGFLCPVGDVSAFAEKINLLADSPGLRKEMGEYNRAKVEKMFTVERMVREYKALFEEVLG